MTERDDAVDERLGLARSGTRFDEQRLVEVVDDRACGSRGLRRGRRELCCTRRSLRHALAAVGVVDQLAVRRSATVAAQRRRCHACVATRGTGRGCRGRRDRCSCGIGAPTSSAGRRRHGKTPASMPSTMARSTSSTRVSTLGRRARARPSGTGRVCSRTSRQRRPRCRDRRRTRVPRARRPGAAASCRPPWDRRPADRARPAGLVVDHEQPVVTGAVDAVGGAAEAHACGASESGDVDGGRGADEPEAQLGGDGGETELARGSSSPRRGTGRARRGCGADRGARTTGRPVTTQRLVARRSARRRSRAGGRGRRRSTACRAQARPRAGRAPRPGSASRVSCTRLPRSSGDTS